MKDSLSVINATENKINLPYGGKMFIYEAEIEDSARKDNYKLKISYTHDNIWPNEASETNQYNPDDISISLVTKDQVHQLKMQDIMFGKLNVRAAFPYDEPTLENYKETLPRYHRMYEVADWVIENIVYKICPKEFIEKPFHVEIPKRKCEFLDSL